MEENPADHFSLLRNEMDPDQAKRFDAFQTAVIPKQAIKRVSRVGPSDSFQSSIIDLYKRPHFMSRLPPLCRTISLLASNQP